MLLAMCGAAGVASGVEPKHDVSDPGRPVREVWIEGASVFPLYDLMASTASLTNGPVTALDLEAVRVALTLKYVTNGYVNSGALIERLRDDPGIVRVRIVEGRLTEVRIQGNRYLRDSFYRRRIEAFQEQPLQANQLRDQLQLWRTLYPLERVNGELRPGASPGEGVLDLKVEEAFPYHAGVQYANDRPPSTGSEELSLLARADSLTRHGDQLSFTYGLAQGSSPMLRNVRNTGLDDLSAAYSIPVNAQDTTLGLHYGRSSAAIVEARFFDLDIASQSESYGISITQPLLRTTQQEWLMTLGAERKTSETSLLGIPYSFSPGAIDGVSSESVLRLSTDWLRRGAAYALNIRLTLSAGFDVFDATRNSSGPDGRFVSGVLQAKYVRKLWTPDFELVLRGVGQYASKPLLSLEQLAIGGAGSVRGYRENTLVRDHGVFGGVELNWIPWRRRDGTPVARLVPFVAAGAGWMSESATPRPVDISSAGIGLVLTPWKRVEASLFWGYAFRSMRYAEPDLQDDGIHFRISTWAF